MVYGAIARRALRCDEVVLRGGPPAMVRVSHHRSSRNSSSSDGVTNGSTAAAAAAVRLPRCTRADSPGRWAPVDFARPFVINGGAIPRSRTKYWLPYGCRPTYWDRAAFERAVAKHGGTSLGSEEPKCHLPNLRRIVFTGSSTESKLFSSLRQIVFKDDRKAAQRNKERDHDNEDKVGRMQRSQQCPFG